MAQESQPSSLCVFQRSDVPSVSNQCIFHVDGLPHVVFCAYALDGGSIVVKQAPSRLQPYSASTTASPISHTTPSQQAASSTSAPTVDPFQTVLLINLASNHWDEPIRHLVWGGGPYHLLAACSKQDISILSLAPFMQSLLTAHQQHTAGNALQQRQHQQQAAQELYHYPPHQHLPGGAVAAGHSSNVHQHAAGQASASDTYPQLSHLQDTQLVLHHPSTAAVLIHSHHTTAALLNMQWTYDAAGLMLSDAAGNIVMLEVKQQQQSLSPDDISSQQQEQHQHQLTGNHLPQQQQHQAQVHALTVCELWRAHPESSHSLMAAGAAPTRPSATVAQDHPQRIIIWWPGKPKATKKSQSTLQATTNNSSNNHSNSSSSRGLSAGGLSAAGSVDGTAEEYVVGAEVIRHPVAAVHIQWSPPLFAGNKRVSSSSSSSQHGALAAAAAAAVSPRGSAAGAAAGSSGPTSPQKAAAAAAGTGSAGGAASDPQLDVGSTNADVGSSSSALMTVGADGIIRIFVEVVMADINPAKSPTPTGSSTKPPAAAAAAAATPGSPASVSKQQQQQPQQQRESQAAATMSQFCLTLVIDPPGLGPQGSAVRLKPGFTACWAKPLNFQTSRDESTMLWLLGSYTAPPLAAAGQVSLTAALAGIEDAAAIQAGLNCCPGIDPDTQLNPAAAAAAAAGGESQQLAASYEDHVYLWGIDGLASVVLSGIAQNAIMSNKMSQPKAWCWGKDTKQLRWQQPHMLLLHAAAAAVRSPVRGMSAFSYSLDVWVVDSAAGPLLSAAQQYHIPSINSSSSSSSSSSIRVVSSSSSSIVSCSESRCFQVTPLTGYNESGQPASAIAVDVKAARVSTAAAEDWVQLTVHQAADIAATVSSRGTVALWSLTPIKQLAMHLQQQQQQFPDSWRQCRSCCWITYGGAAAAAAAAAAGVTGLPLLLAVQGAQGVDICLILLSKHQQQQQQQPSTVKHSSCDSMEAAGFGGVFVSAVHVVAHLDLPAGVSALKQLMEVAAVTAAAASGNSTAAGNGSPHREQQQQLVLQTVLLGLGSRVQDVAGQHQQQAAAAAGGLSSDDHIDGRQEDQSQDVWACWTIQLAVDVPGPAAAEPAAAAAIAGGDSSTWHLDVSQPSITPITESLAAAAANGIYCGAVAAASSSDDDSSTSAAVEQHQDPLSSGITCMHCPSPTSPFFITGTATGLILFWQLSSPSPSAAAATADLDQTAASSSSPMQPGSAGSSSLISSPSAAVVQASCCSVGGVDLGGICVAVALCTSAGYAAAAVTCGQSELDDAIFIWCAEGSTHNAALHRSHHGSSSSSSTGGSSKPRRHAAAHAHPHAAAAATAAHSDSKDGSSSSNSPVFVLDCLVALEDTAASLCWLDTAGLPPLLAVGYTSGLVELYSRDHSGQWNTLAAYHAGLSVNAIAAHRLGLPLMITGGHLLLLSNLATVALAQQPAVTSSSTRMHDVLGGNQNIVSHHLQPSQVTHGPAAGALIAADDQQVATHAKLAAAGSSSLPLYHPDVLGLLIGQGRFEAAAWILRLLMTQLRNVRAEQVPEDEQMVTAAAALQQQQEQQGIEHGSPAGAAGVVLPLNALLSESASDKALHAAVQRCCAFRAAVVAAALGSGSGAAAHAATGPSAAAAAADTVRAQQAEDSALDMASNKPAQAADNTSSSTMTPATPEPQQQYSSKHAAAAAGGRGVSSSALDTGMLDMSAFGGFDYGGDDSWDQQQPAPTTRTPAAAAAAADTKASSSSQQHQQQQRPPANALETGMLDMSAFGGFGFCQSDGAEDDDWDTPAATDTRGAAEPQQQTSAHTAVAAASSNSSTATPDTAAALGSGGAGGGGAADALQTGMLDMSAFGGFGFGDAAVGDDWHQHKAGATPVVDDVALQQQQQHGSNAAAADGGSSTKHPAQEAAAVGLTGAELAPGSCVDPHLLANTTAAFPPAARTPAAAAVPAAVTGGAAAAAAAAAAKAARQQLLSRGEVKELHRLLDVAATAVSDTAAGSSGSSNTSTTAYYARLLGAAGAANAETDGYSSGAHRDGGDSAAATAQQQQQQRGDEAILGLLGLSPAEARKLCNIAAALCTKTFMAQDSAAGADSYTVGNVTSNTSSGVASAAALAASWAKDSGDSSNLDMRLSSQGLTRTSTLSSQYSSQGASGTKGVSLAALADSDPAFAAPALQELDTAAKVFAVNVQLAILQLAAAAAAAAASDGAGASAVAAATGDERNRRFAAAVSRLFQPVSVSRSAASSSGKGSALLAHYPTAPLPQASPGSSGSGIRGTPPLSPGRLQQLQAGLSGGSRSKGSGLGSRNSSRAALPAAMRSSMSVASMLSFSSLKDPTGAAAAAAASKVSDSSSWAAFVGLMHGLTPLHCLWAAASSSQQTLLDVLLPLVPANIEQQQQAAAAAGNSSSRSFVQTGHEQQQPLSWAKLRALGAGFWLTNPTVLRSTCEGLARAQYAASKDPHDPALLFTALGKKTVLQGLFRSSGNKKVADFLARDFTTADGQAAASKNAFHLLGQHRYQLAAAFFILAGCGWDAVSVLAREAADPQLALMVARLLDLTAAPAPGTATGGPLQRRLVNEELLLLAEADSDPAAAALAAWVSSSDGSSAVSIMLTRLAGSAAFTSLSRSADTLQELLGNESATSSADGANAAAASPQQQQDSQLIHAQVSISPRVLSQLPLYLHWLLVVGLDCLSGRLVTGALIPALRKLAMRVARCAEVAGMPWAAAQALAVSDQIGDPCSGGGAVLGTVLGMMWQARLAAAVLAMQLLPAAGAMQSAGSTSTSAAAAGCDVVHWLAAVSDNLPLLQKLGLKADQSAVAVALARHALALQPLVLLPAAAPGDSWCALPAADNKQVVPEPSAAAAAARLNVAAPDSVLAICLSRTSSSMVCSPVHSTAISRTASTTQHSTAAPGGSSSSRVGAVFTADKKQQQQQNFDDSQVLGLSWEVTRQEGDRLRAVAPCVGSQYACLVLQHAATHQQQQQQHQSGGHSPRPVHAAAAGRARPLVFASRNGGIIGSHLCAPAALRSHIAAAAGSSRITRSPGHTLTANNGLATAAGSPTLNPNSPTSSSLNALGQTPGGSGLSGFMTQLLDQLRWPPDPWVVGEFPNRRGHSFGSAGMSHVQAAALAAHPSRPLYVSGSSTGRIHLWQFGESVCKAAYVPMTATQLHSSPKRLAVHEAVITPHWGAPAALRFSRSGGRFGAVGDGGLVGLWRQDFISSVDGLGHAEWLGHCLSKAGTGITFLGDTGSQVIVSGVDDNGGAVVLVDTLAPPASPAAAQLHSSRGVIPTAITLVPGGAGGMGAGPGAVLVVGDDAGELRGYDVRVLAEGRALWSVKPHPGARGGSADGRVTCLSCWDPVTVGGSSGMLAGGLDGRGLGGSRASAGVPSWLGDVVVSGSKDGSIAVVNAHTGSTLQLLQMSHYSERRGLLERVVGSRGGAVGVGGECGGPLLRAQPAGAVAAAVTDVAACGEGVLSVGADGAVRFHPLNHVLGQWPGDE